MRQLGVRVVMVVVGAFVSTITFAITIRASLGLGPLFAVQQGLSKHTGLSLGHSVMITGVAAVALAATLGTRPGPATVTLPFLMGAMLDALLPHLGDIHGLALRFTAVAVSSWVMCLGGALVIAAALGAVDIDGVMLGLRDHTRWRVRRVRMSMEATMLVLGWFLGGAIGVGTVVTGVLVGPSLHFWLDLVDRKDADQVHITV